METIAVQRSPGKQVSGLRPFKNPRRRSSRGSLSRSGGSLALPTTPTSSWGTSPVYPPHPCYSQPPLLPLPRVNSSILPLQRVNSSRPRVNNNNSTLNCVAQTKAISEAHKKKVEFVESVQTLSRAGSVPVRSNHLRDFPKGFDGYPGPAIMLLSPPPSSLPMPRFSIKPKLRCNVEAAGKNDAATDNIRRVLQLR
ncbi:hypothetical protein CARUB_v10010355mg [Capsella rubella]|uniref:Uncharacterized protein n=1 Tax=Capsella rubella TaxID=81985 RepID=R0IJA5_9BRAS|nr:uncharacterized protein LOC17899795 [Capsella rubella]EOA38550.1 hypothetical protein CARUB_v10010355mg [Capsella rubella]